MQNPINLKYVDLFEDTRGIIHHNFRIGFFKDVIRQLLNSNGKKKNYKDLGGKSKINSQKFINCGENQTDSLQQNIDKIFSEETFKSLSEKYNTFKDLEKSIINECLENVNKFYENHQSIIIYCLKKAIPLDEYLKLSLNCLYVSINLMSKYIEHHLPSIDLSDSTLIRVFDGFFDMISSHHLAERICEAILYAMCSLMKLYKKDVNNKFWKEKLEICFLNDKISIENKLASSVILVQLDISNVELLFEIAQYLFNKIDIDCIEYFGFNKSEIIDARTNALNKLTNLLKASLNNKNDHELQITSKIVEYILSCLRNELHNQSTERNDNLSNILWNLFRNGESSEKIKLSCSLAICCTIYPDKTHVIEVRKYINEIKGSNQDNVFGFSIDTYVIEFFGK